MAHGEQVMHPRSVSAYNATEAAEISCAHRAYRWGQCAGSRAAETKYPKAFVIARAPAKYGTNLGFRETRAVRPWHTTSNCKNAHYSRLKTRKKRFYFCSERPLNLGRMETESNTSDFGWGRVVCI